MLKNDYFGTRTKRFFVSSFALLMVCVVGTSALGQKAKKEAKPETGQTVGQNRSTPVDRIKAAEGFEVELLYSIPNGQQGSWVALCSDEKGGIYASDQYGGLYHFTPPAPGKTLSNDDVKPVDLDIRAINGMVFLDGALYAGVNDYERKIQSGLYKISDTSGDGELDKVELLRAVDAKGDHGVHAVVPSRDGKYFYLITGNNSVLPEGPIEGTPDSSPVAKVWGDDHLLPRMPDGRGHNRSVLAPGGIVYRVSRDGKEFEIYASGFRNIYGGDLNKDGELFTYDADMEYDFNTPWYRPTRVNHVVSGAEFGWRNGAGKFPEFYSDTLPAAINIGPGSPTGTRFGYGAKFPAKYQNAFYILDWSWGKIYAVHLNEDGSSYVGEKEDFVTGAPLPVTDIIVHPNDGAMYFAIGGRKVQSGLYRVTYTGKGDTSAVSMTAKVTPARKLRHKLEAYHGKVDANAVDVAWPYLNHEDRFVAAAARVVLEHQPPKAYAKKALAETNPSQKIPALLALTRVMGVSPSQRPEPAYVIDAGARSRIIKSITAKGFSNLGKADKPVLAKILRVNLAQPNKGKPVPVGPRILKAIEAVDMGSLANADKVALAGIANVELDVEPGTEHVVLTRMRDRILKSLLEVNFGSLSETDKLGYVRLVEIVLIRFGDPSAKNIDLLIAKLDPAFPADSFELNWLLCETLAHLQAPNTAAKGMALIASAESQEPQMEYARSLRFLNTGWTPELRKQQLEWFLKAANYRGGASFATFIEFIKNDSLDTYTDAEKATHSELIAKKPERISAIENAGAIFVGRTPTMWTLDELSAAAQTGMTGRDFANGRKMFSAAACYACHRFGNAGGMTGPDLSGSGGRYNAHDFLDQIINPSKEINEQFAPIIVTMNDGSIVSGVVVNLNGDRVTLNTDVSDPNQRVNVDRKTVESIEVSEISPMPPMLLMMLKKNEVLDLVAYVLSGGDDTNAMFK